jgi:hypothetical protein
MTEPTSPSDESDEVLGIEPDVNLAGDRVPVFRETGDEGKRPPETDDADAP